MKEAYPLNGLIKKDVLFKWDALHQTVFQTLKDAFVKELILAMWNSDHPTQLEVDASGYVTGGVLLQQ